MKRCVRVYIEGGAEGRTANSDFRRGWRRFLSRLHDLARESGYHSLEVVRGKGRGNAYRRFRKHLSDHPDDLCVLLADSETAVPEGSRVWDIVANREEGNWQRPPSATERHLYLMVHFVETWLLSDQAALHAFFGQGFNPKPLPTTGLEDRAKADVEQALRKATQGSSRGPYQHGQAHQIIEFVRPERVRTLRHGLRLFDSLGSLIKGEAET